MDDIINEICIRRMIQDGHRHPVLDLIKEIDEIIKEIEKNKGNERWK